jgi:excisionase family DNA binding protein
MRYLREHHDPPLTQFQAMERMGWDTSRVTDLSAWENGRKTPSFDSLTQFLKAVDSSYAELEALELPDEQASESTTGFLRIVEAADHLKLSVYQVRKLANQGHIPYRSIGVSMLFDRPALDAWIIESRNKHFSSNRMTGKARAALKRPAVSTLS